MKKNMLALLLVLCMLLALCAGCGSTTASTGTASAEETSEASVQEAEEQEEAETPAEEAASVEAAEDAEAEPADAADFTDANANNDYSGYKAMLEELVTALPITEDDVTISYWLGYETSTLNYMADGTLDSHQVWKWLAENTGLTFELTVVDKTSESDKFNLMIASGDYTDIIPIQDYTAGIDAAYDDDVIIDLGDYLEENMPNYWKIINSDQNLLADVQDSGQLLAIYAIKDQVANPAGSGTFIRMDWLEDLGMDVPQTYDELTEVLEAFKTEKGASEPMALFNTISMQNGLLMGGFGASAELSTNGMGGSALSGYYQVDGEVVYGATADGTRKYLSWLHELYEKDLIDFDNMQARETNPFSDYNAGMAADGTNGYIFTNQPFGGNYSTMAAETYGDTDCNWWPVQDVAEEAGAVIPFYEETTLVDSTALAVTTQCDDIETVLQFLDYGYSYEGSLLYNFGFEQGSGHDVETWYYDDSGEPTFDADVLYSVADTTNIASGVVSTKDLAGIVFDTRLSFEFGERELSCFSAWSTNKNNSQSIPSAVAFTAEEGTDASALYSDILTYVATSALQFINGDLDVNDDAVWNTYVSNIENMGIDELTAIVQTAYDRAVG